MNMKNAKTRSEFCKKFHGRYLLFHFVLCMATVLTLFCFTGIAASNETGDPFRIGFSKTNFADVNENDALAAVRIWAQEIAQTRGITANPQPMIFQDTKEIETALNNRTIDCIVMTSGEYEKVHNLVAKDSIVVGVVSNSINVEYLLLTNRKKDFKELKDLKGYSLGMIESLETNLAAPWLDITLDEHVMELSHNFFSRIKSYSDTEKGVLSVFFGQIDACVVTRIGFETMVDLNPQIGRELSILAASPPLIKSAFFFRADYSSPHRNKIMSEITSWHLYPDSQQILTIFKTDRLEKHSIEIMDSTLELIAAHERLLKRKGADKAQKTP